MLEDFKKTQNIAYNIITNDAKKNKISHAYLFETNSYPKSMEFVNAFVKFLLCPNHHINDNEAASCTVCKTIDDGNYTELKYIEPDGMWIKKEQLSELQKEFSTKSLSGVYRVYVVNQAEKLNAAAANSILKFLEEPEEGIIAILITDNMYQLLDTIISRCQVISLKKASMEEIIKTSDFEDSELLKIGMNLTSTIEQLKEFVMNEKNQLLLDETINFVKIYEKYGKDVLLESNKILELCKDRNDLLYIFDVMILYYRDMIQLKLNSETKTFRKEKFDMDFINHKNTITSLCKKLKVMLQLKEKIKYNINQNLLLDRLVLLLEEVEV